jgi:hypothetical protein
MISPVPIETPFLGLLLLSSNQLILICMILTIPYELSLCVLPHLAQAGAVERAGLDLNPDVRFFDSKF